MPAPYSSPHHALTLPPTSFTVPPIPLHIVLGEAASYGTEETTGEGSGRLRSALKVTFRPTLQVPSALVGPRVIGRKLEECFDIVVPIGAKVGSRIDVANAPHSLLGEEDDNPDDELGTRDQVHAHIIELINRYKYHLGILSLEPKHPPSSQDQEQDTANAKTKEDPTHQIQLLSATTISSPLLTNQISLNQPLAYLTDIAITFQWVTPAVKKRKKCGEGDSTQEASQARDPEASQEDPTEDDDEILQDDEDILYDDEDERDTQAGSYRQAEDGTSTQNEHWNEHRTTSRASQTLDPTTESVPEVERLRLGALEQVDIAVKKVMKMQMLKRFPLIFDRFGMNYARFSKLPASLISSFAHMMGTSERYQTPLHTEARGVIEAIEALQEDLLRGNIQKAFELPALKARKRSKKSERRSEDNGTEGSQTKGKSRKKPPIPSEIEEPSVEDRIEVYLDDLKNGREVATREGSQREALEAKMKQVLGDAIGRIGRQRWIRARTTGGKLSVGRVALAGGPDLEEEVAPVSIVHTPRSDGPAPTMHRGGIMEDEDNGSILDDDDDHGSQQDYGQQDYGNADRLGTKDEAEGNADDMYSILGDDSDLDILEDDNDEEYGEDGDKQRFGISPDPMVFSCPIYPLGSEAAGAVVSSESTRSDDRGITGGLHSRQGVVPPQSGMPFKLSSRPVESLDTSLDYSHKHEVRSSYTSPAPHLYPVAKTPSQARQLTTLTAISSTPSSQSRSQQSTAGSEGVYEEDILFGELDWEYSQPPARSQAQLPDIDLYDLSQWNGTQSTSASSSEGSRPVTPPESQEVGVSMASSKPDDWEDDDEILVDDEDDDWPEIPSRRNVCRQ